MANGTFIFCEQKYTEPVGVEASLYKIIHNEILRTMKEGKEKMDQDFIDKITKIARENNVGKN